MIENQDKETSPPAGRPVWLVTLGVSALLLVLFGIFALISRHIGLPR